MNAEELTFEFRLIQSAISKESGDYVTDDNSTFILKADRSDQPLIFSALCSRFETLTLPADYVGPDNHERHFEFFFEDIIESNIFLVQPGFDTTASLALERNRMEQESSLLNVVVLYARPWSKKATEHLSSTLFGQVASSLFGQSNDTFEAFDRRLSDQMRKIRMMPAAAPRRFPATRTSDEVVVMPAKKTKRARALEDFLCGYCSKQVIYPEICRKSGCNHLFPCYHQDCNGDAHSCCFNCSLNV